MVAADRLPSSVRRASPPLAVAGEILSGAAILLTVAGVFLMTQNGTTTPAASVVLTLIVGAAVGAVVVRRQPRNTTGWLLLSISFVGALAWFTWEYGYRATVFAGSLPFGIFVLWFGSCVWVPAVGAGLPALLTRLPDGRRAAQWAVVDVLGLGGSAMVAIAMALTPGVLDPRVGNPNPFGLTGADGWLFGVRWLGYAALAVAISLALAAVWSRVTNARGDEREQIKWIASSAALVAAALVYGLGLQVFGHYNLFDSLTPFFISTVALPIAVGIAVLKYRLYDIDLVINRALVYGGLTAMLAGLFTFFVGLTQRLVVFSGQKSDVAILLTAFVGTAAFTPVKNRLQKTVDRRFAVHDPASVVDSMREQIEVVVNVLDAQRIARRLVDDAAVTYQAAFVELALGSPGEEVPFHSHGDSSTSVVLKITLRAQDKDVGVLSLSQRRGGAGYTARDEQSLQLCANAVAEAINLWDGALRSQFQHEVAR